LGRVYRANSTKYFLWKQQVSKEIIEDIFGQKPKKIYSLANMKKKEF
jgi:hypothetical protein